MNVSVFGAPLIVALLFSGTVASQQDDRIYYGSRAGMHLTTAGSQLGFHAPYLNIPPSSYTAENVEEAYRSAVMGIARLIAVADRLYVSTSELPLLLRPIRDEMFMVDTIDAVRFLGVDYTDQSLQLRSLPGVHAVNDK